MTLTFPKIKLPSKITIKKPDINLGILQKSIGYITASISLVPPLRPVVLGITTIVDLASKGKSSEYLNNGQKSNSTLNFVPFVLSFSIFWTKSPPGTKFNVELLF